MLEFVRRTPDGAVLTLETLNRNVLPMNTMAIALGLHVRVGIEDTLFGPDGERVTSVQQIEQMVRIARELESRDRHRRRGATHLPHRRVLPQRRRDACPARLRAQPRARPARRTAARR